MHDVPVTGGRVHSCVNPGVLIIERPGQLRAVAVPDAAKTACGVERVPKYSEAHVLRPIVGKCGNIELVSRSDWGAQPRDEFQKMSLPVKKLFIHHTVTPICTSKSACSTRVKNTQYGHKHDNGWDDIDYNYLVGDDGRAYVGVDWGYVGEHTVAHNSDSVAISAIGNSETLRPSQAILQTIANLIDCALKQGVLDPNFEMFGHKQVSCKACPGKYLYAVVKTSAYYSSSKMPIWCRSK
ncbi:N-acetylmuramoyl-L-alanine amidase [Lamellibrachia satsuma]|nr:N-acetylmuramoyl-L-alanine amidase [Lamellibrachia satsuma]